MGESKITFGQITDIKELVPFIESKELNHQNYCHYSSLDSVNKILKNKFIIFSSLQYCNDKVEIESDPDCNTFVLCFSALYSENLPMWYLYGGVKGKGARITYSKKIFRLFVNDFMKGNFKFYLVKRNKQGDLDIQREITPIDKSYGDVIYLSKDEYSDTARLKYNTHTNNNFDIDQYDSIRKQFNGKCKELPWFYEKEFRLIIKVNDEIAETVNIKDSDYKIAMEFKKDFFKDINIMVAPEFEKVNEYLSKNLDKYEGIKEYTISKVLESAYCGKIKMNLCNRCEHNN